MPWKKGSSIFFCPFEKILAAIYSFLFPPEMSSLKHRRDQATLRLDLHLLAGAHEEPMCPYNRKKKKKENITYNRSRWSVVTQNVWATLWVSRTAGDEPLSSSFFLSFFPRPEIIIYRTQLSSSYVWEGTPLGDISISSSSSSPSPSTSPIYGNPVGH